ncbi:uncharacterized protein LOC121826313 [Peromyscus maniculatus bairdii]|uniref:uncharacterized protein LOC121826313 n=1 Tax=Peromyscus maniculatus bairdii TaxID=230844 RepID=UPI003FD3152D
MRGFHPDYYGLNVFHISLLHLSACGISNIPLLIPYHAENETLLSIFYHTQALHHMSHRPDTLKMPKDTVEKILPQLSTALQQMCHRPDTLKMPKDRVEKILPLLSTAAESGRREVIQLPSRDVPLLSQTGCL